jgi:hypothetical protein
MYEPQSTDEIKETTTMYEYEKSLEVQEESGELPEHQGNTRIRKLKNKKKQKKQKNTDSAGKVRK